MTGALAEGDAPETRPDLDAIQARAEAATPGPWVIVERNGDHIRRKLRGADDQFVLGLAALLYPDPADADFITHARDDVPALLAELAAETARADAAQAELIERDDWENDVVVSIHPSWDGDEAQISILTNFIRHAARLDAAIENAREADGWSGAPLAFVWNDDDRTLTSVQAPPRGSTVLADTVRKIAATLTSPAQIHTLLYAADRIAEQEASA